jgi:ferredoxin hydrogenase small subunit
MISRRNFLSMLGAALSVTLIGFRKVTEAATTAIDYVSARLHAVYVNDRLLPYRNSLQNTAVQQLYSEFLTGPLGTKSEQLLHTTYTDRSSSLVKQGGIKYPLPVVSAGIATVSIDWNAGEIVTIANITEPSNAQLDLFSMTGKRVYSLTINNLARGGRSIRLRMADIGLSHGSYTVVLQGRNFRSSRQISL